MTVFPKGKSLYCFGPPTWPSCTHSINTVRSGRNSLTYGFTECKNSFRSVYCREITSHNMGIFTSCLNERMRRCTIRTVYTNCKETFRSVYGQKIASHQGDFEYFNLSPARAANTQERHCKNNEVNVLFLRLYR